jgi:hypothetical protein
VIRLIVPPLAAAIAVILVACSKTDEAAGVDTVDQGTAKPVVASSRQPSDEEAWQRLESRPLALPESGADGSCPISEYMGLGSGRVLGEGPIHPVAGQNVLLGFFAYEQREDAWYRFKTLWLATGKYKGAAVIRGGRIDGLGELRFQRGDATSVPESVLRLPADRGWAWGPGYGAETRQFPSLTMIDSPGCYAWQVDGEGFSFHVVFSAEEPSSIAPDWTRARYAGRKDDVLLMTIAGTEEAVIVDLRQEVAAFDCRSDCVVDVGAALPAVSQQDEICIGYLYLQGGRQVGKVWVNRYICESGGRVIP